MESLIERFSSRRSYLMISASLVVKYMAHWFWSWSSAKEKAVKFFLESRAS